MYPTIDKKKTGKCLDKLMKLRGLTPKDVQEYLSLTCVQTVYRWLEGINIPNIDNLYALSQLFNVKIDDMIVGSRIPFIDIQNAECNRILLYYSKIRKKVS